MKTNSSVLLIGLITIVLFSCVKETIETVPTVTLVPVTNITATSATTGGEVTSDGGVPVTDRGVCWGTNKNPTTNDNTTYDGTGIGKFVSNIEDLTPGLSYYVRAYATNSIGTAYSKESTINAKALLPSVSNTVNLGITSTSVEVSSSIISDGGAAITSMGFCWATTSTPTINNNKTIVNTGNGDYKSTISPLEMATTYYIRAFATNSIGTSYGEQLIITTNGPTITSHKTIIQYDSYGNITEEVDYAKYSNSNNWINFSKNVYSYDSKNHLTLKIFSNWDTTVNNWINYRKESFSFFAFEQMWTGITYFWSLEKNVWYESVKNEYYLDTYYTNVLYYSYYSWNSSSRNWTYTNKYKNVFTLNSQGRVSQISYYSWNVLSAGYVSNNALTNIYYDSNGYQIGSSSSNNGSLISITYDNNKNPIQKIYSKWDSDLVKYVEKSRTTYTYGSNGYLIEYIETFI